MPSQTTPRLPPRRDSLDDEKALARTDVADPPRFSPRGLEARRDREPLLQAGLRRTQLLHLGALCGKTRRVPVASGASLAKEARPRAAGQYRWYEQGPRPKHPAASGVSAARRRALPAERATRPDASGRLDLDDVGGAGNVDRGPC